MPWRIGAHASSRLKPPYACAMSKAGWPPPVRPRKIYMPNDEGARPPAPASTTSASGYYGIPYGLLVSLAPAVKIWHFVARESARTEGTPCLDRKSVV